MGCREFSCEAISHLEEISPDGIDAMAETGSVAVILPTTAYILRLRPPPVREMIDRGVIVALGTDFNPNAFCLTMVMLLHIFSHYTTQNDPYGKAFSKAQNESFFG